MMTRLFIYLFFFLSFFPTLSCAGERVRIGAENLVGLRLELVKGKRVGIVCNHTTLFPNGTHLVDSLVSLKVNVAVVFAPEHGFRGTAAAGETVAHGKDERTGVPIVSLYGKTKKPTAEMLRDVDVVIFDIQDVGARFYTYISTMGLVMEVAAEHGKPVIILDRPNPVNGDDVEGPVLDTAFSSFIGMFPIPIRHGLTVGELARMIAGEKWIKGTDSLDLTIVPMEGWQRTMWFDETQLPWVAPSPNMRTLATATVYPGMCLFEGTNLSEGRGTQKPFETIGAPWLDGKRLADTLNALKIPGTHFTSIEFTPRKDPVAAPYPKHENVLCRGIQITITDRSVYKPVKSALKILSVIESLHPDSLKILDQNFDRLAGTDKLRLAGFEKGDAVVDFGVGEFVESSGVYVHYE